MPSKSSISSFITLARYGAFLKQQGFFGTSVIRARTSCANCHINCEPTHSSQTCLHSHTVHLPQVPLHGAQVRTDSLLFRSSLAHRDVYPRNAARNSFPQSRRNFSTLLDVNTKSINLEDILSEDNKKRAQAKLETVKPVRNVDTIPMQKEAKISAVLVPLCLVAGEPSILFTLRSSSLRKHRGEVSFPGGNQDKEDRDVVHTALRETFEELSLNPRHFDVWGHLHPTPGRTGKQIIYPVLARYTKDLDIDSLKLSADEVEEVFTCRIQDLCDNTKLASTQFRTGMGYTLPVFLGGPHRIWGLTAVILHQVLTLLAPGLYTFKIRHIARYDV